jgi:hypothetical protein
MIRKGFLLGILVLLVVILLTDFFREVVLYDPLGQSGEHPQPGRGKEEKARKGYEPGWAKAIYEKDLFSRDRGYVPPPPPVTALVPPPPPRPEFHLEGIVLRDGKEVAIVESPKGGVYSLVQGDVLENALLLTLDPRKAVFKWMDEEIVLSMEKVRTLKR